MLRYASAPDGTLHIGELRVALINYILSRQKDEGFVLWIDDTQQEERIQANAREIPAILEKFAIQPEQTLYARDHQRRHQQLALRLAEEKQAFLCLCGSKEGEDPYTERCLELESDEIQRAREKRLPYSIRIRKPSQNVSIEDRWRGTVEFTPTQIDHFLLLRDDGSVTRNFALACDDMTGAITQMIQEEHQMLPAARQSYIRHCLGFSETIEYVHLPPLVKEDGSPVRSEDKEYQVVQLLMAGYLPDTLINYLLLLGYRQPPKELFTLPEAIEWFDLDRLSTEPLFFDLGMLQSLNRAHLLQMEDLELSRLFRFADPDIGKVAKLYLREGAATLVELEKRIRDIFTPKRCNDEWGETMQTLSNLILEAPMIGAYDEFVHYLEERSGLQGEALYTSLRLLMTGSLEGPDLSEIYSLLNPYITEIVRCQH